MVFDHEDVHSAILREAIKKSLMRAADAARMSFSSLFSRRPVLSTSRLAHATVVALVLLLLWDLGSGDMALARRMGGPDGFPLRDGYWMTVVLHEGAKRAGWLCVIALCMLVVWPVGPFVQLPFSRRLQLAAGPLLASGAVSLLKATSLSSCPWDMAAFGGLAQHLSHWRGWFMADGGAGHCFPAGHASVGFCFATGYFALRHDSPRLARGWLVAALAIGLSLGVVQQLRGAHFLSHTLWTGWICWLVGWLTDPLFARHAHATRTGVSA